MRICNHIEADARHFCKALANLAIVRKNNEYDLHTQQRILLHPPISQSFVIATLNHGRKYRSIERYTKTGLLEPWEITPNLQLTNASINRFDEPPSRGPLASVVAYLEERVIKKSLMVVIDDLLRNLKRETAIYYERFHASYLQQTSTSLICTYSTNEVG